MNLYLLKLIFFTFLLGTPIFASWSIPVLELERQGQQTRLGQLTDLLDAYHPAYDNYISAGWVYIPSSLMSTLATPYGDHHGFAFRHRVGVLLQNQVENSNKKIGLGYWIERQGWQHEDFAFVPVYGTYGLVRNVQTYSAYLGDVAKNRGAGVGFQWQHDEQKGQWLGQENDHYSWFGHVRYDKFALQSSWNGLSWGVIQGKLELGDRAVQGKSIEGWKTYLPDISASVLNADTLSHTYEILQNLYKQKLYLFMRQGFGNNDLMGFELRGYADASHLVGFGLGAFSESNWLNSKQIAWNWGGWFEVPFFKIGYNALHDNRYLFGAKSTWIAEFQISLGSIAQKSFFRLNAPQSAELEAKVLKQHRAKQIEGAK